MHIRLCHQWRVNCPDRSHKQAADAGAHIIVRRSACQECSHRFCRPCLESNILGQLREGALSSEVACATCRAPMSIRDVQVCRASWAQL